MKDVLIDMNQSAPTLNSWGPFVMMLKILWEEGSKILWQHYVKAWQVEMVLKLFNE